MNSERRHIGAVLLGVLVLLSTFTFAIDSHYCGDLLIDQAVFGKAKDCGMEAHRVKDTGTSQVYADCCSELVQFQQGQEELRIPVSELKAPVAVISIVSWIFCPAEEEIQIAIPLTSEQANAPPGRCPLFIRHHSLLI